MKLIDVETVYGTFAPNVRYTGNEIMALLMQQPEAYNIENVCWCPFTRKTTNYAYR